MPLVSDSLRFVTWLLAITSPALCSADPAMVVSARSEIQLAQADSTTNSQSASLPEDDLWANVEEMMVMGSGRASGLLNVPTSVTSFDSLELEAQAVQDVSDLSAITPNLEIRRSSATQATFFIRGVGLADFGANATSAVAVSQDGIGLNTAPLQLGQIFDAGGVDVLRGPQGTGAFRNASAGAIMITSRKPEFEMQAYLRTRLGTWAPTVNGARYGLIQDYEGALNVPILEDVLAVRFSFRVHLAEPYKVNGCGNAQPLDQRVPRAQSTRDPGPASQCGEKEPLTFPAANPFLGNDGLSPIPEGLSKLFGEEDNWAARALFLYHPVNTEMEFLFNGHVSRLDQQPVVGQALGTGFYPQGNSDSFLGGIINGQGNFAVNYTEPDQRKEFLRRCNSTPPTGACANPNAGNQLARSLARNQDERPFRGDYNREGQTRLETWGVGLTGTIPILDSGFSSLEITTRTGFDTYERYQERDLDNTPETIFESQDNDETHQIWQSVSAGGELGNLPIEWNSGFFYFYEDLDADLFLFQPESPFSVQPPGFFGIQREYEQKTNSFGVWAGGAWNLLENFTLDTGARYNWENKTFNLDRTQAGVVQSIAEDETWGEWTGMISLQYAPTEDVSLTLKYSRGFKPGTFNAGVSGQSQTEPVDPESVDSFEGILSMDFWQGRIQFRGEIFFYLYENYQIFLFNDAPVGPPVLEIQNADEVENFGADIDFTLQPLDGLVDERWEKLKLNLRFGWLESEFVDFTNTRIFDGGAGKNIAAVVDFSGNRLPNSPRFTVSGVVDWAFDLGRFGQIIPRYDFTYTDDVFFDAEEGRGNIRFTGENVLPEFTIGQRAYILHNMRLTYLVPSGNIEIAGWIRNIRDTRYKTFAFDASQFSQLVLNNVGDPRTFGVDLKVTF
jgi:outer membrane receptor protein involved in Fe transport